MFNFVYEKVKVIAKHLVIAFFFVCIIIFTVYSLFGLKMEKTVNIINKMAMPTATHNTSVKDIKINKIKKRLNVYPGFGEKFGSVLIPSINVDVVLYHGESLRVLKYGLGHHAGSYFPGEGGTVLIAGHNTLGVFYNLPKVKIGDNIKVKTVYGTYNYQIIKTDIDEAVSLTNKIKINNNNEELILYTCYPVEIPGFKTRRFVVYAKLVGDNNEE